MLHHLTGRTTFAAATGLDPCDRMTNAWRKIRHGDASHAGGVPE